MMYRSVDGAFEKLWSWYFKTREFLPPSITCCGRTEHNIRWCDFFVVTPCSKAPFPLLRFILDTDKKFINSSVNGFEKC